MAAERFLVGVHFSRHRGGPGHVTVAPGELVLTTRSGKQSMTHRQGPVRLERKRFEPPWGNHWIALTDGAVTAHVVTGRKRAERVLAAVSDAGFTVLRS